LYLVDGYYIFEQLNVYLEQLNVYLGDMLRFLFSLKFELDFSSTFSFEGTRKRGERRRKSGPNPHAYLVPLLTVLKPQ
jgi:hypothetical protein